MAIVLTGTQGGPTVFNGQAGAGTLVSYGDESDGCSAMRLQFDAGRGTSMRLSQINVTPIQLNAIFLTHIHGDHTEGLLDVMALRWYLKGPKVDVVCSADKVSIFGFVNSCRNYVTHIADAFLQSGEVAERLSEDRTRLAGGPADLANVLTFEATEEPQVVWVSGDVKVSAIRSTHIAGHASYRVDTPAGSVVIGGDASNDKAAPPVLPGVQSPEETPPARRKAAGPASSGRRTAAAPARPRSKKGGDKLSQRHGRNRFSCS
jgi:ribonuclease Z